MGVGVCACRRVAGARSSRDAFPLRRGEGETNAAPFFSEIRSQRYAVVNAGLPRYFQHQVTKEGQRMKYLLVYILPILALCQSCNRNELIFARSKDAAALDAEFTFSVVMCINKSRISFSGDIDGEVGIPSSIMKKIAQDGKRHYSATAIYKIIQVPPDKNLGDKIDTKRYSLLIPSCNLKVSNVDYLHLAGGDDCEAQAKNHRVAE